MNIIDVYIGCLTILNGPEAISVEFFSNEGKILNLNFISTIAHIPNNMKKISAVSKYMFEGINSPDKDRYIMPVI